MANLSFNVIAYRVHFYGHSQMTTDKDKKAAIFFIGNEEPPAGPVVARVYFYSQEALDAKQDALDARGRPEGHMAIDEIEAILDMLRYEKPIRVFWDDAAKRLSLETGQEPVGEQET
ncbi:MAG TPA: hypothetical protein VID27_00460 [Blastocatellia bacterium]|jgi:hypothetical protein